MRKSKFAEQQIAFIRKQADDEYLSRIPVGRRGSRFQTSQHWRQSTVG